MTKLILSEELEEYDYAAEFDAAKTTVEKQNIIQDFIRDLRRHNPNLQLTKAYDDIEKMLLEQGSRYLTFTNPFLQALVKFSEFNPNVPVNSHMYSDLVYLFGDGVISQDNMLAIGKVGKEDIIFVPSFYELNDYEKQKYLAQVYYWLHNEKNVKSLNLDKVFENGKLVNDFCKNLDCSALFLLRKDEYLKPENIANLFCFINEKFDYNSIVRDPTKISTTMDWLDTVQSELGTKRTNNSTKSDSNKKVDTFANAFKGLSQEEKQALMKQLQPLN